MKLKTLPTTPCPKPGDLKTVRRFAWWPKHVEDQLIWLEYYEEVYIMKQGPVIKWIGKYPIPVPWGWYLKEIKLINKHN